MWLENYNSELYHYGVKGMKWGVRRYQNYDGSLTKAAKDRVKDKRINKKIEEYIKSGKAKVENLESYPVAGLTTITTKKGEQFVSGLMNGHDFDWQELNLYSLEGLEGFYPHAEAIKNKPEAFSIKKDNYLEGHDDYQFNKYDMKWCNPGYGREGTTQNCAKCSASLELRLRGYEVTAGRQTYPSSVDAQSLWFKDAKRVDYSYEDTESSLRSYGPRTSGTIGFQYPGGVGGHSVHWTNDANGNFEIQDGQNGKKFSSLSEMMDEYGGDKSHNISTFRLDNCEPNWDMMSQDSVIRSIDHEEEVRNRIDGRARTGWMDTY